MTRPVVWVLVNDLGRTGVPIALARLAAWSPATRALDLRVIARQGGPVEALLTNAGVDVVVLEPPTGRSPASTVAVATAQLGWPAPGAAVRSAWWRRQVRHLDRPDIVLIHGAGALPLAAALGSRTDGARVVLHLHELDTALGRSATSADLELLPGLDHVMAVTEPVRRLAVARGVDAGRTSLVPGAVDDPPGGWDAPSPRRGGPDPVDVVSIGEAGWRKGTDRAIAAAYELRRLVPAARWHWVGTGFPPAWAFAVGSTTPLEWHDACGDPWALVAAPAVVVIPSREDPLPLVALEAGARAIPVVATATGGLPALLADRRGTIVGQGALQDLVAAVQAAIDHPGPARLDAERLWEHVRQHHRLDAVGPRWLAALTGE